MTPHTPGPWRIEEHYAPELGRMAPTPYIVDAGGQNVAAALLMVPEQEANARLIAAAPALLAALQQIMDDGGWDDDGDFILYHVDGGTEDHEDPPALIQARAALRAALGDGPVRAQEAQERASDQERAR